MCHVRSPRDNEHALDCEVLTGVLRGLTHNSRDQMVVVDLTPFDASLPIACLELNASAIATYPTISCVSALWFGKPDVRKHIAKFVNQKAHDRTAMLIRGNTLKLPGLPDFTQELSLPTVKKPTLDESKFELTAPMSDGTLRFHQAILDVWGGNREFKEMVEEHNKKFNPSGASFKAKREAENAVHEESETVTIDPGSGPKTKGDVQALHKEGLHAIPGSDTTWELLIAKTGELYLSGLSDTVVTSSTNLGGFGQGFYEVGGGAEKVRATHTKWMEFKVANDQGEGIFVINPPLKEKYPDTPHTMRHFLLFLEGQGQVNVQLINHKITRSAKDTEVTYTIESQTPSVFEVQQKFNARAKPTRETACALIDMAKAKSSQHVRFIQSFTCPHSLCGCSMNKSRSQPARAPMRMCTQSWRLQVLQGGQHNEAWSLVPVLGQERAADQGQRRAARVGLGLAWPALGRVLSWLVLGCPSGASETWPIFGCPFSVCGLACPA